MSKQSSATLPSVKKERIAKARRSNRSPSWDGQPMSVLTAAFFAAIARGYLISQLNKLKK